MRHHYHVVDVFTAEAFGGNPLAVFADARGIGEGDMQRIAREFNLSETTFVLPPEDPENDFCVRIFTPSKELPMAGHPTVGTAFVLARLGRIDLAKPTSTLRFEEGVGPVPVQVDCRDGAPVRATMQQPLPEFGPVLENRAALAAALSLAPAQLADWPAQIVSCGVEFVFVPVRDREAAAAVRVRSEAWEQLPDEFARAGAYVFTLDCEDAEASAHGRCFAPQFGIGEDPATGGACGPLGSYLVHHGILAREAARAFVVEQGIEMGRPSRIEVGIDTDYGRVSSVRVGGSCVAVAEGEFEVAEGEGEVAGEPGDEGRA